MDGKSESVRKVQGQRQRAVRASTLRGEASPLWNGSWKKRAKQKEKQYGESLALPRTCCVTLSKSLNFFLCGSVPASLNRNNKSTYRIGMLED